MPLNKVQVVGVELLARLARSVERDGSVLELSVRSPHDRVALAAQAVDVAVADKLRLIGRPRRHRATVDAVSGHARPGTGQAVLAEKRAAHRLERRAVVLRGRRDAAAARVRPGPRPAWLRDRNAADDPGGRRVVGTDIGVGNAGSVRPPGRTRGFVRSRPDIDSRRSKQPSAGHQRPGTTVVRSARQAPCNWKACPGGNDPAASRCACSPTSRRSRNYRPGYPSSHNRCTRTDWRC